MMHEAYGVNKVLISTWFVAVVLANLTVFLVLVYRLNFKRKSRSLVLLSSTYYILYSLQIAVFALTSDNAQFSAAFCSLVLGALSMAVIVGNIFCVLGVTIERFVYIVYALQYKRIINAPRVIGFALLLFSLTLVFVIGSLAGGLQYTTSRSNNTVICVVDNSSTPTLITSYTLLILYVVAFLLVPVLWLRIHFIRRGIKKIATLNNSVFNHRHGSADSGYLSIRNHKLEDVTLQRTNSKLEKLRNVYNKASDNIVPCELTPKLDIHRVKDKRVTQKKSASQASFLSSTKSSKHTIKIFLVSFLVLKFQYICFFPPFLQIVRETDNLSIVMLISFADALFGCLLLIGADVELKQIFFRIIRVYCFDTRRGSHFSHSGRFNL